MTTAVNLSEPVFYWLLQSELSPGMVCVDIGAGTGTATILMASIVSKGGGKVYSIEHHPPESKTLKNIVKTKNFETSIIINSNTIISDSIKTAAESPLWKGSCDFIPLSEYMWGKSHPNFIRIGYEAGITDVIRGSLSLFKTEKFPCKIITKIENNADMFLSELENLYTLDFKPKYYITSNPLDEKVYFKPIKETMGIQNKKWYVYNSVKSNEIEGILKKQFIGSEHIYLVRI